MRSPDVATVRAWLQDPELLRLAFGTKAGPEALGKMGQDYCKEMDAGRNTALAVDGPAGEMLGFVRFSIRSHHRGRMARVGILIGDRRHWGQGLGTEAMEGLLLYLFERRGIHIVELDTADFNHRARKCFEKVGFHLVEGDPDLQALPEDSRCRIWMEVSRLHWERRHRTALQP